ncbi:hypothetical protein HDU98_003194 [Podochytrium sp. JEL0797]|nr:hypothetical protein HDU98_003194 [Podochytrium sp. JEL0797]
MFARVALIVMLAASAFAAPSNACADVANNLIVCKSSNSFSICTGKHETASQQCAPGTVCCGTGGHSKCVWPTDASCGVSPSLKPEHPSHAAQIAHTSNAAQIAPTSQAAKVAHTSHAAVTASKKH